MLYLVDLHCRRCYLTVSVVAALLAFEDLGDILGSSVRVEIRTPDDELF